MKKVIFGVIVMAVVVGCGCYFWHKGLLKNNTELQIEKTKNVVTSVRQIAELVSMNYYEEFALSETKTCDMAKNEVVSKVGDMLSDVIGKDNVDAITKDELVIIANGHVRAGYNLAEMTEGDVRISGDTLFLALPEVQIIDATVNPSDFDVFIENGKWSHQQVQKLEDKAIAELKRRATKAGVLEKAEKNGIAELTNMYKAFGFKEVVCTR